MRSKAPALTLLAAGLTALAAGSALHAAAKPDVILGKTLFRANCGTCHTLSAAGTHGKVGPNLGLDTYKYATVVWMINTGNSTMPAFKGTLTIQHIADIAAFVAKATSE